jgi:hypothetical protein
MRSVSSLDVIRSPSTSWSYSLHLHWRLRALTWFRRETRSSDNSWMLATSSFFSSLRTRDCSASYKNKHQTKPRSTLLFCKEWRWLKSSCSNTPDMQPPSALVSCGITKYQTFDLSCGIKKFQTLGLKAAKTMSSDLRTGHIMTRFNWLLKSALNFLGLLRSTEPFISL